MTKISGDNAILRYEGKINVGELDVWSNVRVDADMLRYESGRTQRPYPERGVLGELMHLRDAKDNVQIVTFCQRYGVLGLNATFAPRQLPQRPAWTPNDGYVYSEPIGNYQGYGALVHALHSIQASFQPDNITEPKPKKHWTTVESLVVGSGLAGGEALLRERTGLIVPSHRRNTNDIIENGRTFFTDAIECRNGEEFFARFASERVPLWAHVWLVAIILGGMVEFETAVDTVFGMSESKEEEAHISLRTWPRLSSALDRRFGYESDDGLIHLAYCSVLAHAIAELMARAQAGSSTCVICDSPTPSRRSRTCCEKHAGDLARVRKLRWFHENKNKRTHKADV